MLSLILLILIVASIFVARRYLQEKKEQHLRDNPPERRVIQVSLPGGISSSPKDMTRFYRTVAKAAAAGGKKERQSGARQLDFVFVAEPPAEGAEPVLTARIYCDPDRMDSVKRSIKQVYNKLCDVNEIPEDDLMEISQQFRPQQDPRGEDDYDGGYDEEVRQ